MPTLVWMGPVVVKKNISLNSSMYFRYFVIFSLWKGRGSLFEHTCIWIPDNQIWFMPSLIRISPVVLEKILKFCQCIFVITPLGKGCCLHLNKIRYRFIYKICNTSISMSYSKYSSFEEEMDRKGGKGKFKIAKLHLITSYW